MVSTQTVGRVQMPESGIFMCKLPGAISVVPGDKCIVEFDYGLDYGILRELLPPTGNHDKPEKAPAFRVVRKCAPEDTSRFSENDTLAEKAKHAFDGSIRHEKGNVKILHVRFSYGRDRLFIRYSAAVSADLRRFVGQLQRDFKTHVDLWQVGVRDEAALIGCLGSCGRTVCCKSWQRQFLPVNVRMAKEQEMSLNPVSINGSCGRLKCCLRFEHEQYCQAGESLPTHGTIIASHEHENTEGVVIGRDVMRGRITVRTKDGRFLTLAKDAFHVVHAAQQLDERNKEVNHEDSAGEWA